MQTLPVRTDISAFVETVAIGATIYQLDFHWNTREENWYMSIREEDGAPIIEGQKLVADWPLFVRFADARLPEGVIFALDTQDGGLPPGRADLGERTKLLFATDAEVAAL